MLCPTNFGRFGVNSDIRQRQIHSALRIVEKQFTVKSTEADRERRRCVWQPFPFVLGAPTNGLASPGHRLVSLRRGRADASLIVPVSTRVECLPVLSPFPNMISVFPRSPPLVSS
jgi:hypothetical protein